MAKRKDPLKLVPQRLPESLVKRIDVAAASLQKKPNRTATTIRLIQDGFKWWAREDLEQDTTLQMVTQMHERTATILAMQNVMVRRMGFMDDDNEASFKAEVQEMKRVILKLGGGVAGYGMATDSSSSGGPVSDDDDGDDGGLDESDVDGDEDDDS